MIDFPVDVGQLKEGGFSSNAEVPEFLWLDQALYLINRLLMTERKAWTPKVLRGLFRKTMHSRNSTKSAGSKSGPKYRGS